MAHTRRPKDFEQEAQTTRSDWLALVESVRDHPMAYIAGVVFIAAVIVIVAVFREVAENRDRKHNSALARALAESDSALRLDKLTQLGAKADATDETLYLLGEAAFDQQRYDESREAFDRLRREYPQSSYVPDAVEGIADIEFDAGNYDKALALYSEIRERWPAAFAARRQPYNIGQANERLGKLKEATEAYQEQVSLFSGSTVAATAQAALDRLKRSNPELFPAEPAVTPVEPAGETPPGLTAPLEPSAGSTPVDEAEGLAVPAPGDAESAEEVPEISEAPEAISEEEGAAPEAPADTPSEEQPAGPE